MRLRAAVAALILVSAPAPAHAAPRPDAPRVLLQDFPRRIDVNRLNLFVTNVGFFGFDVLNGNAGLYYPKGSPSTLMFSGGLWLGLDTSPPRVALAEYSSEYGPGVVFPSGLPEGDAHDLFVYKMSPWTGDPDDTAYVERTPEELAADPTLDPVKHHAWSTYVNRAATRGAPTRMYRLPLTDTPDPVDSVDVRGPDVIGDQMLWCVYNDADPGLHTASPGATAPIGVEVQQTVFGFNRSGAMGDIVFLRYRIINRTMATLTSLIPATWSDLDLGGFTDDLIGTDIPSSMGYAYNGDNDDTVYGSAPPAVGLRLLSDPLAVSNGYINGTDPSDFTQTMNYLRGLNRDGSIIINPVTNDPTQFMFSGDPVTGTGWLDSAPSDRRMLVSGGGGTLAPGESKEFTVALIVGAGQDRLNSILRLRCGASAAAAAYASGFTDLPVGLCPGSDDLCPRPLTFWENECVSPTLPPEQLATTAVYADLMSNYFDWSNAELSMCAVVQSPAGDLRTEAERQFAAFLMNINSGQLGFNDANGKPIAISPLRPVNCPGIDAETVADLMRTGSNVPALTAVTYMNVPPNPKALSGVNVGLPFFDGGAGLAYDFFGSTLNPVDHPDSFATVEVQFGGGQKAYRYLRLERASDGLAPPQGRGYLYAGFHDIPLEVRDEHGAQLEVGFVERVLTEDDGTILPLEMQPATYDSTWGPDDSELGGREYLFVCRPVYTGSEDPNFQVDGALNLGLFPALYALWSRKNNPGSIIDPFDVIRFEFGGPPRGSIDQMMIDLAGQPLSDPDVQAAYSSIVFCLEGINNHCDIPTPVLATLVQASASPDAVELAWYAPGLTSAAVQRNRGTDWVEVAQVSSSRRDRIEWTDRDVLAGERYGYRLVADGQIYSETWVDVPSTHRLALAGVQPNPSNGAANVSFSLKRRAPAKLEVMDIQGRRVARKDLSDLGPGSHVVRVPELERLPAGIYLLRLTQDRDVAIARMVRVN